MPLAMLRQRTLGPLTSLLTKWPTVSPALFSRQASSNLHRKEQKLAQQHKKPVRKPSARQSPDESLSDQFSDHPLFEPTATTPPTSSKHIKKKPAKKDTAASTTHTPYKVPTTTLPASPALLQRHASSKHNGTLTFKHGEKKPARKDSTTTSPTYHGQAQHREKKPARKESAASTAPRSTSKKHNDTITLKKIQKRLANEASNASTTTPTLTPGVPTCPTCNSTFFTCNSLAKHIRFNHPDPPPTPCPYCALTFNDPSLFADHAHHVHRPPKPRCPYCQTAIASPRNMARHIRAKHPAPPISPVSPLDEFFATHHPDFAYDATQPASTQFVRLVSHRQKCGDFDEPEQDAERVRFGTALRGELIRWFGGDEVHALDRLWRAVGRPGVAPGNVVELVRDGCGRAAEEGGWKVNLVDLVAWARAGAEEVGAVRYFWGEEGAEEAREYAVRETRAWVGEWAEGTVWEGENDVTRLLLKSMVSTRAVALGRSMGEGEEEDQWQEPTVVSTKG